MPNIKIEGRNRISSHLVISTFLVLLFLMTPASAAAKDSESINALRQMGKAFAEIAERTSPAVVGIEAEKVVSQNYPQMRQESPFEDDFFEFFFGPRFHQRRQRPRSRPRKIDKGSGFIISSDGYILTNNHIAGEAEKIIVKLKDGKELEAKLIGTDPESDVAVIKIDAKDLTYLELADSDALEVGEWVLAIGNPFGLSHSVTAGIVSAKGRNVGLTTYEDFIQTDAAINPGNSGGPLLNLDGKVVGISTAIISRSGGNMGIGLVIPINMAKNIYEQLIDEGKVVRGFLGVLPQDLTADMADHFDLEEGKGALIAEVTEDSAADKAGLQQGDVIIEFNGKEVENANSFRRQVAMVKPGTKVKVVLLRSGEQKTLTVKLTERTESLRDSLQESKTMEELGLSVENLTEDLQERLGFEGKSGVVVTGVESGSIAASKGIRQGMLIQQVNKKNIKNTKNFNKAMKKARKEGSALLLVYNGRFSRYVLLPLPKK